MRSTMEIAWRRRTRLIGAGIAAAALASAAVAARTFGEWSEPVHLTPASGSSAEVNTPSVDGCPILSPYDGSLYMASNRPGGEGDLDIWIAPKTADGWGDPVNAGPTINTAAQEFCPSPARGNRFFFVRRSRPTDTDIYVVKKLPTGWGTPELLPKGPNQINSDGEEWSPSWFEASDGREFLYFSSTRNGAAHDIFYSVDYGAAERATGGVDSAASDARPNVRRDGLEIVWDSTRAGGAPDIWTATRSSVDGEWGTAEQLGNGINSAAVESRPSLSWDGTTLMFGSSRMPPGEGATDIYMSTREKVTGRD